MLSGKGSTWDHQIQLLALPQTTPEVTPVPSVLPSLVLGGVSNNCLRDKSSSVPLPAPFPDPCYSMLCVQTCVYAQPVLVGTYH